MAFKITVQELKAGGKVATHVVETATDLAGKTATDIANIAHKILTAGGGLVGILTYIKHEKKAPPPPPPPAKK